MEQLGPLIPRCSETFLLKSIPLRNCFIMKDTLKFHHQVISWTQLLVPETPLHNNFLPNSPIAKTWIWNGYQFTSNLKYFWVCLQGNFLSVFFFFWGSKRINGSDIWCEKWRGRAHSPTFGLLRDSSRLVFWCVWCITYGLPFTGRLQLLIKNVLLNHEESPYRSQ